MGVGIVAGGLFLAAVQASAQSPLPLPTEPAIAPAGSSEKLQDIKEVKEALTRFSNMDFDGAVALLKSAAKQHASMPPVQLIMAEWFAAANQPQAVLASVEQAVVDAPEDPEPYVVLGDLALRNRQVAEAGLLYAKAGELLKTFKDTSSRKSLINRRMLGGLVAVADARQNWTVAQTNLEAILADMPKNAGAMQQLGRVLFMQKKYDDAMAKFQAATKLDEKVLPAEVYMSRLYLQAGDKDNSKKSMVEAVRANKKDLRTRLAAAQWSFDVGKYEQAEEQAREALKMDANSLDAKMLLGVSALYQKEWKVAEEQFLGALMQQPSLFAAQLNAKVYNDNAEAASTLGWVLFRLGKIDDAENMLRRAASGGRISPDTAYFYARVLDKRGQKEQARKLLESIVKGTATFSMRPEAESLLTELKK
jgi:tetratricopeptide (TPR) repeat protein